MSQSIHDKWMDRRFLTLFVDLCGFMQSFISTVNDFLYFELFS
jgi:hypothetical protein